MTIAAIEEIQNGSLVSVVAKRGAAVFSRPSAALLTALADHSLLNEGLNLPAELALMLCRLSQPECWIKA
jgi:hypothetical protein